MQDIVDGNPSIQPNQYQQNSIQQSQYVPNSNQIVQQGDKIVQIAGGQDEEDQFGDFQKETPVVNNIVDEQTNLNLQQTQTQVQQIKPQQQQSNEIIFQQQQINSQVVHVITEANDTQSTLQQKLMEVNNMQQNQNKNQYELYLNTPSKREQLVCQTVQLKDTNLNSSLSPAKQPSQKQMPLPNPSVSQPPISEQPPVLLQTPVLQQTLVQQQIVKNVQIPIYNQQQTTLLLTSVHQSPTQTNNQQTNITACLQRQQNKQPAQSDRSQYQSHQQPNNRQQLGNEWHQQTNYQSNRQQQSQLEQMQLQVAVTPTIQQQISDRITAEVIEQKQIIVQPSFQYQAIESIENVSSNMTSTQIVQNSQQQSIIKINDMAYNNQNYAFLVASNNENNNNNESKNNNSQQISASIVETQTNQLQQHLQLQSLVQTQKTLQQLYSQFDQPISNSNANVENIIINNETTFEEKLNNINQDVQITTQNQQSQQQYQQLQFNHQHRQSQPQYHCQPQQGNPQYQSQQQNNIKIVQNMQEQINKQNYRQANFQQQNNKYASLKGSAEQTSMIVNMPPEQTSTVQHSFNEQNVVTSSINNNSSTIQNYHNHSATITQQLPYTHLIVEQQILTLQQQLNNFLNRLPQDITAISELRFITVDGKKVKN